MNAIFLVTSLEKINEVYDYKVIENLVPELLPINAYTQEDVRQNKEMFKKVKYIFSTWYMPLFTTEEIKKIFPLLEAVFYAAGSVKYFAEPFLKANIRVFSAGKANAIPVAEFVSAQIILANKGYFQVQKEYKKPLHKLSFNRARNFLQEKHGNYEAKVGLIGAGMVATKVIELLKSYHLEIYVYDPYVSVEKLNKLGATKIELDELFRTCDVISNHLPDTIETKGMLNYSLFSLMKPATTFINTGRGGQLIEKDLTKALRKRKMACALLDVTAHEPLWPWSSLNFTRNIFITPHIAGSVCNEEKRLAKSIFKAYKDFKNGIENSDEITLEMLNRIA